MKKFIISFILLLACVFSSFSLNSVNVYADTLNLDAKAYILIDYNSGTVLVKENEQQHLEVASMVKLMTSLLTIEKIEAGELDLNQKVMVSEYAASQEGSQAFLDANQEYSIDELLKSVIIASANDSSVVLAEAIAGTEENFVKLMNKKAKELGLNNTKYANSTGLPSNKEQYSCAEDIAKLLQEEIKHELYFKYSKIWIDEIIHASGRRTELVNTNILIRQYNGCDIGKTGFTDEAGYCLSASSLKNSMRLVSVVIGAKTAKDRFTITTNLLNYGFNNFENKKIVSKNEEVNEKLEIKGGINKYLNICFEKDFYALNKKGDKVEFQLKYEFNNNIKAPINCGDVVGKAYIIKEGAVVGEINIVSNETVNKITFKDGFKKIISNFSI